MAHYLNNREFEGVIAKYRDLKQQLIRQKLIVEHDVELHRRTKRHRKQVQGAKQVLAQLEREYKAIHDELGRCLWLIADGVTKKYHGGKNIFGGQSYDPDDAVSEIVLTLLRRPLEKYDSRYGGAFSYFTEAAIHSVQQLYRAENTRRKVLRKYQERKLHIHGQMLEK